MEAQKKRECQNAARREAAWAKEQAERKVEEEKKLAAAGVAIDLLQSRLDEEEFRSFRRLYKEAGYKFDECLRGTSDAFTSRANVVDGRPRPWEFVTRDGRPWGEDVTGSPAEVAAHNFAATLLKFIPAAEGRDILMCIHFVSPEFVRARQEAA